MPYIRFILFTLLLGGLLPANPLIAAERPNFVVIMVDDLGWSDLGCYGSEIQTPHLDRLAANGLKYTQFYNTAKCHSSRVCLLTGQYCHQADGLHQSGEGLSKAVTIGDIAGNAGYYTAMVGKWHLDGNPVQKGFQRYWGHLSGATNFFTGDDTFRLDDQPWNDFDEDFYTTDKNTDYAIEFLKQGMDTEKPFLLYLAYNAPHYPLHVREEDYRKYETRYQAGWDELRKERFAKQKQLGLIPADATLPKRPQAIPAWSSLSEQKQDWERRRMAAYAGMIDRVDQQIGRLIAFLKQNNALENTVITFCSDNGGCPFERTRGADKEPWDAESYWTYDHSWAWVCNTPWKYYKQNEHEGGISSPMIVHWPAGISQPRQVEEPTHLIDILPTIQELSGGHYPETHQGRTIRPVDGLSMASLWTKGQWQGHDSLFFHFSNNRALRQGNWKLVSATGGAWELYNLATDRMERQNLAEKHPGKLQQMIADYEALWEAKVKVKQQTGIPTTHKPAKAKKKKKPANKQS